MTDKDTPNRSGDRDKAEGDRWSSEKDVIPNSESSPGRGSDSQNPLPERGRTPSDRRNRNNEDIER
jgi:hypothetical protein